MAPIPKDTFNGMIIGASRLAGGVYSQVAPFNSYDEDPVGLRTSISLLAPGQDVELSTFGDGESMDDDGTSFAAPHVTGTVALLQQFAVAKNGTAGWDEDHTKRHEVMKAVLMNSADKIIDNGTFVMPGHSEPEPRGTFLGMERTVLDYGSAHDGVNPKNWLQSEAYLDNDPESEFTYGYLPLDDQMGAGHLNAKRALQQFAPGEFESDASPVATIGWDYGHTTGLAAC
jgi:subtilisin family serine protease